uniref:Sugar phosphate transporter domain-containing protein n=1 Tax=Heterosigma akashiwo TaxID=2829 RepID=A0A7S3UUW0_HETAK
MELVVLIGVVGNILSVVGVVMLNKYLVQNDSFNFMIFISFCHFVFTTIGSRVLLKLGAFQYKEASIGNVLPVALGSLGSVAFMNLNLSYNSVGFYQISKLACIPVTIVLQAAFYNQHVPVGVLLTLIPILVGMSIATVYDVQLNFLGSVYAACGVICTVGAQIFTNTYQKSLGCNALQLLYHTSPLIAAGMLLLLPLFDSVAELRSATLTAGGAGRLLLSCVFALGVNISNYLVLGKTSPLTYQVLGHFKTILIILLGIFLFNKATDSRNILGIAIALLGVIAYTEAKRKQSSALQSSPQILPSKKQEV